jgi:hypothetical protein
MQVSPEGLSGSKDVGIVGVVHVLVGHAAV